MSYTAVTVTCSYSASVTGSVVFTPTAPMSNGGVIAPATPVRVDLAGTSGSAVLKANDDVGTTPSGVGYTVVESIDGAPSREFVITLRAASPAVNLGDLAPAVSSPLYQYAPLVSPAFTGTPTVNGQPIGSGGTGTVTSVAAGDGTITIGGTPTTTPTVKVTPGVFQAADADLTTIAALDATQAGVIASDGAGWLRKTYAQIKTALALVKADVGLGSVDNTADASKPVSTAQAAANTAVQAFAIQRGNHTGTQSADTLTDGTTNKAFLATERTKLAAISGTNTGDQTIALTGDVTGSGAGSFAATLKNTGTAGTYGDATHVPQFTTDGQGRVTGVTSVLISGGGGGSTLTPTATKTAPYTAAVGDLAMMNVPGGASTLTLPTAPADKSQVAYNAIGATAAVPLTISRGGSDTIGTAGATSATVPLSGEVNVFQYDAGNTRWLSVANVKTLAALDARYAPASVLALLNWTPSGVYSTSSTTLVDIDATNIKITFTAPASGSVIVTLTGWLAAVSSAINWAIRDGSTTKGESWMAYNLNGASMRLTTQLYVTGLTPGTSYTYKWAQRVSFGAGTVSSGSGNSGDLMTMIVEAA